MTESTKCLQCDAPLPPHFPPGLCPACLLRQGMSPSTLTGAAGEGSGGSGSGTRRGWIPPTVEELTPKFPQWEIVALLGQGGMGAVYKVRQRELDRWAALKVLPDEVASDPNFAERFQREARTLAQLSHQHIVTVYEFGQRGGVFYLLMEFVDGVTLRQAIRAGTTGNPVSGRALAAGPVQPPAASALPLTGNDPGFASPSHSSSSATPAISASQALAVVGQICDALQFAHEEGVVHRDIKPENILIDKRGRVKIADFGLAKLLGKPANLPTLTGTHQIMGTPAYMAPEQMEGSRSIDHRADIFSLGVVFYELLTGELPLGRFAPPSQKYSLDVRLDEVVLRTLEKNPDRRYQQASAVKLDVESIRSQPVAAGPTKTVKPRRSWSVGKSIVMALIIAVGTFSGLVGTVFFISWLDHQPGPSATLETPTPPADQQVAAQRFMAEVQRQKQEQERQKQLEEAARDPYETNAVVQFTADGVKLHPHGFGTDELTAEQRVTVEKILTDIHREYLKVEATHSQFATEEGLQSVLIERFDEDLAKLENALWTAVDTQLPIAVQKLLRQQLPLFADPDVLLPQVGSTDRMMGSGGGFASPAPPAAFASAAMGGSMSSMGAFGTGGVLAASNLRYQQLLGWKQNRLPLQITIRARGKWRRWEIGAEVIGPPTIGPGGTTFYPKTYTVLDSGEAPELPSGLRRFWQESPKAGGRGPGAHGDGLDLQIPEIGEDESREDVMWTNDGVRLGGRIVMAAALPGKQLSQVNQTLSEMHRKYVEVEAQFTEVVLTLEGHQRFTIQAFPKEQTELENELWTKLDAIVTDEKQRATLHGSLPLVKRDFVSKDIKRPYSHPELFGWIQNRHPIVIEVWRKGTWFHWTITPSGVQSSEADGARLPGELARFWREEGPLPNPAGNLAQQLLALDKLRAADKTPWDEVEQRANELIAKYTAPADKGRIHWMAAHVYGQSDIRGHGAEVILHAQEALKYERDPVQRGWLYMYLGDAAGLDAKSKDEATRWYLKGYFELIAFNLPDAAPELPTVGKFRGVISNPADGEADNNQIVFEVLQAAEVKARKEAELVRDLVSRRNIYIGQIQTLFGRQYTEGSDEAVLLKRLATEILRDEVTVGGLLSRVWPDTKTEQPVPN